MQLQNLYKLKAAWLPAPSDEHPIVLSSRVRLARNLSGSNFPDAAPPDALLEVRRKVFETVRDLRALENPAFLPLEDLDPVDLRLLLERHLVSQELAAKPKSRGLAVARGETLSVMVNEEDHLRLQAVVPGYALNAAYADADKLDTLLGRRLGFAFSPRWGYLTACPTNAGTGLRASVLAHLGGLALLGRLEPALEEAGRRGLLVRGFFGEGSPVYGDLLQFSTGAAMGKTEPHYIADLAGFLKALFDSELRAQRELKSPPHRARFEDAAWRSWGLLMNAKLMSYEELMRHWSVLRLAARLELAPPLDAAALFELAVSAQPAHLQYHEKRLLSDAEDPAVRAEFIRARLKPKGRN